MPELSPLPERLRYLQPFRKKFAKREPQEETATEPLFELLHKRVNGRSSEEATAILGEDFAALEKWLAEPEQQNDCLAFALGVFLAVSPDELAKHLQEEFSKPQPPLAWVEMELPPDAKVQRFEKQKDGGLLVKWKGLWMAVSALAQDPEDTVAALVRIETQRMPGSQVSVLAMQFGDVVGRKIVTRGEIRQRPYKGIRYVLTAPGGNIDCSISAIGKKIDPVNWDESKLEACFATLRVVPKQPAAS